MSWSFLIVLMLVLLGAFWLGTMRARDQAREVVAALCQRHGLQLLDQSVALGRLGLARRENGNLVLLRRFSFAYSENGFHRRDGEIWMRGGQPQRISLQTADGQVIEEF